MPIHPRRVMRRASRVSQILEPALFRAARDAGAEASLNEARLRRQEVVTAAARPSVAEVGSTGVPNYAGVMSEEYLSELKTPALRYRVMSRMRADAQISALMAVISLPIQAASFSVEPNPRDPNRARAKMIAAFIGENLFEMDSDKRGNTFWNDFVRQALLMLAYGFSLFEIVYERVPGERLWRWQKFSPRHWNTITKWNVDESGELVSVTQEVRSGILSSKGVDIPADRLLRFTWRQEGGNYEGRSLLRDCYKHWWFKDLLYRIQAIGAERMGIGIPVFHLPRDVYQEEKATIVAIAKSLRVNQESGLVLPEGYEFDFVPGHPFEYEQAINHHNRMIALTGLAQFLNLGESSVGSFALSKSHGQFFILALRGILDYFVDVLERTAFRRLVDINWGADVPAPELKHEMFMLDPLSTADSLTTLVMGGLLYPDETLLRVIREQMHLPPMENPMPAPAEEGEGEDAAAAAPPLPSELFGTGLPERLSAHLHDPTPPSRREFWRVLTAKEESSGIRELKDRWDEFDAQLRSAVSAELYQEAEVFLEQVRRLLLQRDLVGIGNLKLPRQRILMEIFDGVGREAREWARLHAARNLQLEPPAIERRVVERLSRNLALTIPKLAQQAEGVLTRKLMSDGELLQQFDAGLVLGTTLDRVVEEARENLGAFVENQLPSYTDAHVNDSVRAGRDALVSHARVIKVQRTEILDSNTCGNCRMLDGSTSSTRDQEKLQQFMALKPPAHCQGGRRCRGVLLFYLDSDEDLPEDTRLPGKSRLEPTAV